MKPFGYRNENRYRGRVVEGKATNSISFIGEKRDKFVFQDDDGFWAQNKVKISTDRKSAKQVYQDNWEDIDVDSEFNFWRTGDLAIDVIFDSRIQDDLIKAELLVKVELLAKEGLFRSLPQREADLSFGFSKIDLLIHQIPWLK